ncbi:MAG: hypothetical protein QOG53_3285 [Frankiales bacterium]|nr:hypothetical protein [Frankiales bacterium]
MNTFRNLCRSELHRLVARRLTRVLLAVYVVFIAVVMLIAFAQHSKDPNAGRAAAERAQRQQVLECMHIRNAPPGSGESPAPGESINCDNITVPVQDKRWGAVDTLDAVKGFLVFGALLGFLLGASAGGAEWAAGTLQALLFWEPRRIRVMAAKAIALAIVVTGLGVIGQACTIAATWLVTITRGTTEGYTTHAWQQILGAQGRGVVLLILAAITAFSVSSLTRHTTAALGAAFAYLVIAEPLLLFWKPRLLRYLFGPNVGALIDGKLKDSDTSIVISGGTATVALCLYTFGLLAIATALFARRDVT